MSRAAVLDSLKLAAAWLELEKELPVAQPDEIRSIVEWAETNFFIPETSQPVQLEPFQKALLRYIFPDNVRKLPFTTVVWSSVKKQAKTATAGLVARYYAETQSMYGEVFTLANDFEQAQGRIFKAAMQSIELHPDFERDRRILPGKWLIRDREARHLPSGSVIKASASEYKSAAGSNPGLTLWSELWAFQLEASRRLWDEMTPVPTRPNSMRWVETYAGFDGESDLLNDLMDSALDGRHLTARDLGQVLDSRGNLVWPFTEAQHPDAPIPCWVNDAARLFMFYDTGKAARRQPWQLGESGAAYYAEQERTLRPSAFRRLHLNERVSAEDAAIPLDWWDACQTASLPPPGRAPIVIALDAGVSSDTFAIVAVSRHPERRDDLAVRGAWKLEPPKDGTIDFAKVEAGLRARIAEGWNIVQICYDPYQLHDFAMRMSKDLGIWFYDFNQGAARLKADRQLYDLIRDRRIAHTGWPDLREHIGNANAKTDKNDDSKFRLVKRGPRSKIDLAVALSMACHQALRLSL